MAIFADVNDAVGKLTQMQLWTLRAVAWLILWLLHLTALLLALVGMWGTGTSPAEAGQATAGFLRLLPVQWLIAGGVSGLGLLGLYVRAMSRLSRWFGQRLLGYVTKPWG